MEYGAFYTFLTYVQIGSILLTFVLQVLGIVVGIFALRALLIYIRKDKEAKTSEAAPAELPTETFEDIIGDEAAAEESGSAVSLNKPQE